MSTVVTFRNDTYVLDIDARIGAPFASVQAILTDYANLTRVNPAIVSSEVLKTYSPVHKQVRTLTRACLAFFCRNLVQIQDVRQVGSGEVVATTEPKGSDFRRGLASWHIWPDGAGTTRVHLHLEIVPAFWVPPVIGPWVIKHKLTEETLATTYNLERIAGGIASR